MNTELYEIVSKKFRNYGADEALIARLARYGEKPFLTWISRSLCKDTDGKITETLATLAEMLDLPYHRVRYAFFSSAYERLYDLKRKREYKFLRATLLMEFNYPELWDTLLPYFYQQAKDVAVEILLTGGIAGVTTISMQLAVSKSQVYKIQKTHGTKKRKERRAESVL